MLLHVLLHAPLPLFTMVVFSCYKKEFLQVWLNLENHIHSTADKSRSAHEREVVPAVDQAGERIAMSLWISGTKQRVFNVTVIILLSQQQHWNSLPAILYIYRIVEGAATQQYYQPGRDFIHIQDTIPCVFQRSHIRMRQ